MDFKPIYQICVSKQLVDFGKELFGNVVIRSITINNSGNIPVSYVISGDKGPTDFTTGENETLQSSNVHDLGGFSVDGIRVGRIEPGLSALISFKWEPQFIGPVASEFVISSPPNNDIVVNCKAECVSGSISLSTTTVDFKVCLFGDSYQELVSVVNRNKIPKMVKFTIPWELSKHLQVTPRKLLVQGNSSFNFQFKFTPRNKLHLDAPMYFDEGTRVLEVLVFVQVPEEQELSVAVLAVVTNDDVTTDPACVDFGSCTTYGKISVPVTITSHSLLPQEVTFVSLPPEIAIQCPPMFGKLCPLGKAIINLVFQPSRTCTYEFDLLLINGRKRMFPLVCRGVGKVPSLKLSHQVLVYKPTSPNDVAKQDLTISNESCGTRLFEFGTTDQIPVYIHPRIDKLLAREERSISVIYKPVVREEDVVREALSMRDLKRRETECGDNEGSEEPAPTEEAPFSDSELVTAKISLLGKLQCDQWTFNIPCFIAEEENDVPIQRHDETLFLQVHCQICPPELLIMSDGGSNIIDFGDVLIGLSCIRTVAVRNIADDLIQPTSSCLDPFGNFELLNDIKPIHSQETRNLRIKFSPTGATKYHEEFSLSGCSTTLHMIFKGRGCQPCLTLSLEDCCLDFRRVMAGEVMEEAVWITNETDVPIKYDVVLEYFPQARMNNLETFSCMPSAGQIEAGTSQEITLVFRSNLKICQQCVLCRIMSSGKNLLTFFIKARTEPHSFYVSGLEINSDGNLTSCPFIKEEFEPIMMKVPGSKAHTCFFIGCSKMSNNSTVKKSVDWSIECSENMSKLGFTINPTKGSTESGNKDQIYVSWKPTIYCKKDISEQAFAMCVVHGEITKKYKIFLYGVE